MSRIRINAEVCKKCGTCVLSCPAAVFVKANKDSIPEVAYEEFCVACGHCVAVCPNGTMTREDFPDGTINPINQDILPSAEQVLEIIRVRRSIRAFRDTPVEKERIERIIDGARFAPSAHNEQNIEFVVVQDKDVLNKITALTTGFLDSMIKRLSNPTARDEATSALHMMSTFERVVKAVASGEDRILRYAPVLLVFHADKKGTFPDVNANLALQNASLIAQGLGLGAFYAGFVVAACKWDNSIARLIYIPDNHQIYAAMAIGYPKFKYKNWIERKAPKVKWM